MSALFSRQMAMFICLFLMTGFAHSQAWTISGRVLDSEENTPLPFVNIIVAGQPYYGTSTDLDGYFELAVNQDRVDLEFSYLGYQKKLIPFSSSARMPIIIHLAEQVDQLAEVTVFPGVNPAHRIIRNAVKNREINNPENLPSFSYETYGKFVVTVNTDSLDTSIDTVYKPSDNDSVMELDSSNYMLDQFMQKQHLLFMETVTERKYIRGKRDNEEVIASRMSGFKNPIFALINTQMQSFTFYDDYISIAGQQLLNPITPGSTSRYFFLLRDTLYNSESDTVFVISFRPRPNYGFDPMQGVLYINTSNWAIQNVIARPVETEGVLIEIEQKYKRYDERTWFPDQLNAKVILGSASVNGATPEARLRTYLRNVQLGAELQPKNISRAVVTIADDSGDKADELLLRYRQDSLDSREARTYEFMDSISEAENFERGLDILISLAQGRIPLGPVDLVLDRLVNINQYEGFRPGLEFRTNDRLSKWLRLGAYGGYGFRDKAWKYDFYTNIILNKHSNLKLIAGHKLDIREAARQEFIQTPYRGLFQNNFRQFFVDQVDQIRRNYFGFTWDPWGNLGFMAMLHQEQRNFLRPGYDFIPSESAEGLGNQYNFTEAVFSLRYAPKEDFVEAPGFGRIRLAQKYPLIYFQYTRGLAQVLDGDFEYNKFDLLLHHKQNTLFLGELDLVMQSGLVLEELPYSKIYTGMSNLLNRDSWWERMGVIADRYSFETMRFNEFAYDRYIQLMYRQNLKTLLFRRDWLAPHVEIVARALWGFMGFGATHEGIDFSVPERGYYEGGLELNQLLVSGFSGLGLGFYYRLGPYSLPSVEENFAAKLTFTFTF